MIRLKIAALAHVRGLSLPELQRASGLSSTTLRRYWHNQLQRVTFTSLDAIARALAVPIADLFTAAPPPCDPPEHDRGV